MVRQWGAGCLCQGDKDAAATFHGTLLGNHFEIPPKPSHGALCQEPRPAEQRRRVCRSHFGARLLSWPLHFRRGLMCSGVLELGEPPRRGGGLGLAGQCCPPWLLGKPDPAWSCSSGPAECWHQGRLRLLAWAYPLSPGTSTLGAYLTDPSSSVRQRLGLSPFHS